MKHNFGAIIIGLLIISSAIILQSKDKKEYLLNMFSGKSIPSVQEINENQVSANNDIQILRAKSPALGAEKIRQIQKPALNDEDECKIQADKWFLGANDPNKSSYRSHWNTQLKACLVEVVLKIKKVNNPNLFYGILNYDITDGKVLNTCTNVSDGEVRDSCIESTFINSERLYMSQ